MMRSELTRSFITRMAAFAACLLLPAALAFAAPWITPDFALSADDLQQMTAPLPEALREGILERPAEFLRLTAKVLDEPAELFVLVDKSHALPADFVPPDLAALRDYPLRTTRSDLFLRKLIMPAVLEMVRAAQEEGVTVVFSSTYRSYDYQRVLYEREVKAYGRETADRESARPGLSQHQLGTAVDFGTVSDGYEKTREGTWVSGHAEQYGFSLSYPRGYERATGYRYESWHYRYITRPGTLLQREFFGDVQQYLLEFLNDNRARLEQMRVHRG